MNIPIRLELLLRLETTCNPTENAPRGVLGQRVPNLVIGDGDVGVIEECRRYQDGRPWRKLYDQLQIPQHEMTSAFGIEASERSNGTPANW